MPKTRPASDDGPVYVIATAREYALSWGRMVMAVRGAERETKDEAVRRFARHPKPHRYKLYAVHLDGSVHTV